MIGDDNDDFILIGTRRDFVAQRDGVLFLGVNEGDLADNTGSYDVAIEAEAGGARVKSSNRAWFTGIDVNGRLFE